MAELVQNVFASDCIYRTTLTAPRSGFYRVDVCYNHDNWDTWMKLEVVGAQGETFRIIPPLPRKYNKTTLLLYLFQGQNRITAAPRYDQPVVIRDMYISEEAPVLTPTVTPSSDWFYREDPSDRRLTVVSYTGTPVAITAGERAIPFVPADKAVYNNPEKEEELEPFYYYHLRISAEDLMALEEGVHELKIHLPEGKSVDYTLHVAAKPAPWELQIVSLDVNHGNCALLRFPNGKNLLIDTGTQRCAKDVIFPYLDKHGIRLDYLLISHFHGDHDGSLAEVRERYPLPAPDNAEAYISASEAVRADYLSAFSYLDCTMLRRYDRLDRIWDLGGVEIRVLNSHYDENGNPVEGGFGNDSSVSLLVRYNDFQYYHGADNHAHVQRKNLEDFTAWGMEKELCCHYMQANHHFHGDLYPQMIRAINPVAVLVPASAAIYSRSAFLVDYLQSVVERDFPDKRLKETFVSYFSGTVRVSVNNGKDWHYETC